MDINAGVSLHSVHYVMLIDPSGIQVVFGCIRTPANAVTSPKIITIVLVYKPACLSVGNLYHLYSLCTSPPWQKEGDICCEEIGELNGDQILRFDYCS
ncbi:hypothetical protein CO180_04675 [candidate division WWE3 bacterium CG_4_9_14_3_um_filter_41_6]|uniref:Uncharacterized protein n=1 Tax=candidate division WWE3 bacterium CG_4_10_14_0_2_um_filter_41_14 TaxID=1975072 RepID=A0A2M7TLP6_UNCKA|nr:MAG: hypothetical protein COY32_00615 [candidate division WWE3 bacterium CG_4_10_14_0_2_um_filter_41_14]PJA37912.1 MAG: hypothetical protein CO180_04675 [candidate division WWE3 bacterium CG_4_9_14_3_um_filter_41_6]